MFYDQLTSDYIVCVVLKKVTTDVSSNLVYYTTTAQSQYTETIVVTCGPQRTMHSAQL